MEIKEERRRARGWRARRREEGESARLPRAGSLGSADTLRGAPRWGRAESFGVSGPRHFLAACGQPAAGGPESRLGGSRLGSPRGSPR